MTTEDLHIILEGCKHNNRDSQEKLYKYYYADMVKVCQRYVDGDDQKIVSILNDAYLKMFKNIDRYDASLGDFTAWFKTIVINTALSAIKAPKRQIDYQYPENLPEPLDPTNVYSKFDMQELLVYIRGLPNVTRAVFNLSVMDGFSHQEIAEKLNITESTSRWHLSDARRKLKDKLKINCY